MSILPAYPRPQLERAEWFCLDGEWEFSLDPKDESYQAELGAILNLKGDRAEAEAQFDASFKQKPDEFWNTINAAGSYLGVRPE